MEMASEGRAWGGRGGQRAPAPERHCVRVRVWFLLKETSWLLAGFGGSTSPLVHLLSDEGSWLWFGLKDKVMFSSSSGGYIFFPGTLT